MMLIQDEEVRWKMAWKDWRLSCWKKDL